MSDITITEARAVELLREVVAGREEYTYQKPTGVDSCVYTSPDNAPSCIVGHALARAGVPTEVLHAIDYGGAVVLTDYDEEHNQYLDEPIEVELPGSMDTTGISDPETIFWLNKNDVQIDERALRIFTTAQREQDNGVSWGGAFARATQNVGGR